MSAERAVLLCAVVVVGFFLFADMSGKSLTNFKQYDDAFQYVKFPNQRDTLKSSGSEITALANLLKDEGATIFE